MAVGLGLMGLAPDVFWRMTPREFAAAVTGRLGGARGVEPMTGAELRALMAQFPDHEVMHG